MELLVFNQQNSAFSKKGRATIRFSRKSGLISFSKETSERLHLNKDSRISICQDKKNPEDWYICKSDPNGFEIRTKDGASSFNNTSIANKVLDSLKIANTCAFQVGSEPAFEQNDREYWAIITSKRIGQV